jgi:hypothetical protein
MFCQFSKAAVEQRLSSGQVKPLNRHTIENIIYNGLPLFAAESLVRAEMGEAVSATVIAGIQQMQINDHRIHENLQKGI